MDRFSQLPEILLGFPAVGFLPVRQCTTELVRSPDSGQTPQAIR